MEIKQYEIFWVDLEPTQGAEINKIRPRVIISPNEMNENIKTLIIAPMTTNGRVYPTRVEVLFQGKVGYIILDQIKSLNKSRLRSKAGMLDNEAILKVKSIIKELLVDGISF